MDNMQREEIEQLIQTCEIAKDSVDAFLRSINDFIAAVDGLPAIARPLVRRDLESNSGLSADEWIAFLERLGARYDSIYDAAQRQADALAKENDGTAVDASKAALQEASAPLIEGADVAIEQLETMSKYLEGLPAKVNMVPDAFLKGEARDALIASVPGHIERAQALKDLIAQTKGELSSIAG